MRVALKTDDVYASLSSMDQHTIRWSLSKRNSEERWSILVLVVSDDFFSEKQQTFQRFDSHLARPQMTDK